MVSVRRQLAKVIWFDRAGVCVIEPAADLLGPIEGYHWRQLLAGEWMATDAAGLKVLVPQMKTAHNGYLEVYRAAEKPPRRDGFEEREKGVPRNT